MSQPTDRFYARTHEWVKVEGDTAVVGITAFAQEQLGDVVFVDLPAVGQEIAKDGKMGDIESVKAVSEVFSPVAGTVTAVNAELETHPELVNQDPFESGWLTKLRVAPGAAAGLMDAAAYETFLAEEGAH